MSNRVPPSGKQRGDCRVRDVRGSCDDGGTGGAARSSDQRQTMGSEAFLMARLMARGVSPRARMKLRRIRSRPPKPAARAISAVGRPPLLQHQLSRLTSKNLYSTGR
jgi:hypothetical protein